MLSLFPSLFSWSELAPFLLRLTLGAVFIYSSARVLRDRSSPSRQKAVGTIEVIAGSLLIIGLWTQLAALVLVVDLLIRLIDRANRRAFLTDGVNYYLLLLVMAISLLVMGAGFFAFDYRI